MLTIPIASVIEASGKQQVYLQNGDTYQAAEVTLGQTSGDMVEVKTGLFEGDMIVTQRAPQLYAQSLRGDTKKKVAEQREILALGTTEKKLNVSILLWIGAGGTLLTTLAFMAGTIWAGYRSKH